MTGWFSDPGATREVALGDAWFKVRFPLSKADILAAAAIENLTDDGEIAAAVMAFVPEWNLPDHTGAIREATPENFIALSVAGQTAIVGAISKSIEDSVAVPNASGAPSPASSRGSASRTRKPSRTRTT